MKLVVQLPALNEEKTIASVIRAVPREIEGVDEVQVIVVDDGSTDRTAALAREAGAIVLTHEVSRGVGAAFRTGLKQSTELGADIVVTIDADGQFNPDDIRTVAAPILKGEAEFVTASRFIDPSLEPDMPKAKRWGNDFIARWVSSMVKKRFYDVSCGFRAYSKEAYLRLILLGDFTYTHEVFLTLAFSGVRIQEVPVRVRGVREHGVSRVANNLFHYGWRTASIILKTYRDYRPLGFFSKIAMVFCAAGLGFLTFLGWFWATTGGFSPHKWAGFTGGFLLAMGVFFFIIGIVAEMLDRIRVSADEALFRVRRLEWTVRRVDANTNKSSERDEPSASL